MRDPTDVPNDPVPPRPLSSADFNTVLMSIRQFQAALIPDTDAEILRGLRELSDFTQNLRIVPPGTSFEEQSQALYPVRMSLYWLPITSLGQAWKDPNLLLFNAHYMYDRFHRRYLQS